MGKKGYIILGVVFLLVLITVISSIIWYMGEIKPVDKNGSSNYKVVEIKSGTSTREIIKILKDNDVIKSELATKVYIKLHEVRNLQAGKYKFNQAMSLEEILAEIASGKVMDETIKITFQEGKNMRYIVSEIVKNTTNSKEDVYDLIEDKKYITSLIDKYWFLTKEVRNKNIYYALEGYLYPSTYEFASENVDVKTILEKMLDQTNKVLTKYKNEISNSGYTVHEILTMASIVELEGNNAENRPKIASVIFNRLKNDMSLGSDVTTYYAIKVDMGERDLYAKEINTYNAYNTRGPNMNGKLPVGPIANSSEESIKAVLNPDKSDYLYFVVDKNGEIYFSKSNEEHESRITDLKKKGLWYEY